MPPEAAKVLADFRSGDPVRIHGATGAVMDLPDGDALAELAARRDEIVQSVAPVDLGGLLMSNRVHFDHAMARLDLYAARLSGGDRAATCYCRLLQGRQFARPERIAAQGRIAITGTTIHRAECATDYAATCTDCGALLTCREEMDWHMPTYHWRRATDEARES